MHVWHIPPGISVRAALRRGGGFIRIRDDCPADLVLPVSAFSLSQGWPIRGAGVGKCQIARSSAIGPATFEIYGDAMKVKVRDEDRRAMELLLDRSAAVAGKTAGTSVYAAADGHIRE